MYRSGLGRLEFPDRGFDQHELAREVHPEAWKFLFEPSTVHIYRHFGVVKQNSQKSDIIGLIIGWLKCTESVIFFRGRSPRDNIHSKYILVNRSWGNMSKMLYSAKKVFSIILADSITRITIISVIEFFSFYHWKWKYQW